MTTTWAHLPNSKYIDLIIEDVKINPKKWAEVWQARGQTESYEAAWEAAYKAVCGADRKAVWDEAWGAVYDAAREAARVDAALRASTEAAAWVAILALIVYDNCAELLNADPEQVKILALLGDQKAILLHPACVALQKEIA